MSGNIQPQKATLTGEKMLQAGTDTTVSTADVATSYAWYEFDPMETQQAVSSLSVVSGSSDYASVTQTGSCTGQVYICSEPPGGTDYVCTSDITVTWGSAYTLDTSQFGYGDDTLYDIGDIDRYYYYVAKTETDEACIIAPWAATTGSIADGDDFPIDWAGYGYPIVASSCGV